MHPPLLERRLETSDKQFAALAGCCVTGSDQMQIIHHSGCSGHMPRGLCVHLPASESSRLLA